ncbi:MAG: SpaH/EbpB family LPXTG-anchored major pilin [Leucobacter sp.]
MKNHRTKRGLLAAIGALATAALLAAGGSAVSAAPPEVPASANVHIFKSESPATANHATGNRDTAFENTREPINDVVFVATPVPTDGTSTPIDLSTNAGQADAAGLDAAAAQARIAAAAGLSAVTFDATGAGANDDGWTTANLPRGLYLVTEQSVPTGVTPAAPFLVAVPLTDPTDTTQWLTDIYVYPKNDTFEVSKSVTEVIGGSVSRTVGQNFAYTILGDIPADRGLTSYTATDTLDANLSVVGGAAGVTVELTVPGAAGQLAAGDYTVGVAGGVVTVVINSASGTGLAKINGAGAASQLRIGYTGTVAASAEAAATTPDVTNSVAVSATNANGTSNATDSVVLPFGDVRIEKQSSNAGTRLAGAEFRIYTDAGDAAAGNGNYLTVNGKSTWETATAPNLGLVDIKGLLPSNFVNGVITTDTAAYRPYYLVEVKAPTGHQLLADPIEVLVLGKAGTVAQPNTAVTNIANGGGFQLPLTGGTGTAVLTIAGIVILSVVLLVARRRRAETISD